MCFLRVEPGDGSGPHRRAPASWGSSSPARPRARLRRRHVGLMGAVADAALGAGGEVDRASSRGRSSCGARATVASRACTSSARCTSARRAWPSSPTRSSRCPAGWARSTSSPRSSPGRSSACTRSRAASSTSRGYFAPLVAFFDRAEQEGFLRPEHRRLVVVEARPGAAARALRALASRPRSQRWIDDRGAA